MKIRDFILFGSYAKGFRDFNLESALAEKKERRRKLQELPADVPPLDFTPAFHISCVGKLDDDKFSQIRQRVLGPIQGRVIRLDSLTDLVDGAVYVHKNPLVLRIQKICLFNGTVASLLGITVVLTAPLPKIALVIAAVFFGAVALLHYIRYHQLDFGRAIAALRTQAYYSMDRESVVLHRDEQTRFTSSLS